MRILLFFVAMALSVQRSHAEEAWNQFRGPEGNGHSQATGLPVHWSETENVRWKTAIHGKGWSSPVIQGKQIWLTTATKDGKQMFAVCLDSRHGEIVHDLLLFENAQPQYCHPQNSYASPTPVIDENRLYVHFGSHGTACLDVRTRAILWSRRDLHCDHFRGPGSSPIINGNLMFATFDGFDLQYIVALDKMTGRTVWKKDRAIDYGTDNGDAKKAFGTPIVITHAGRTQLVSPSAGATIAYLPETGEELWRVRHGGMNAAARPLFDKGRLFLNTGSGGLSLFAMRPEGRGDLTENRILWKYQQGVPKRASQLLVDGLIYMLNASGVATCIEAETGQLVWKHRIGDAYWSSPVYAEGRLYFLGKEGTIPVLATGRTFRLLATNRLDSGFLASPAVAGNALYLRSKTHLYRIEKTEAQ